MNEKGKSTLGKYQDYLKLKRYSKNTIKNYSHYLGEFILSFDKSALHITKSDVKEYLLNYDFTSGPQQNTIISCIKLFCRWFLDFKLEYVHELERPRKEKKLPRVIDQYELKAKIELISNLKHKAILALAFSDGLRVSEIINMKIRDIDSSRMVIHIKNAKGRKDRIVPLSKTVLKILREYYKEVKPKDYLFNGQSRPQYSSASCNKIFKKYVDDSGHFHLLRHSGLTAMLDNGANLREVQEIAGHNSSKTTEIYTHVSVKSLQSIQLGI